MDERRLVTPEIERETLTHFRLDVSPEEFAARFGHEFATFNFHKYRYPTPGVTEWIDQLAAFFLEPGLPARLRAAREKYLTPEEIAWVEKFERDPF
jgi:hypothetical protein